MSLLLKILGNMLMCIGIIMIILPVAATALGVLDVNGLMNSYVYQLSNVNTSNSLLQSNATYNSYDPSLQPYIEQASNLQQLVNNIEQSSASVQNTIDNLQQFDYNTNRALAISLFAIGFIMTVIGFIFTKIR